MRLEPIHQRRESDSAMSDLVCKGRQAEFYALSGITLRLSIEGRVAEPLSTPDPTKRGKFSCCVGK